MENQVTLLVIIEFFIRRTAIEVRLHPIKSKFDCSWQVCRFQLVLLLIFRRSFSKEKNSEVIVPRCVQHLRHGRCERVVSCRRIAFHCVSGHIRNNSKCAPSCGSLLCGHHTHPAIRVCRVRCLCVELYLGAIVCYQHVRWEALLLATGFDLRRLATVLVKLVAERRRVARGKYLSAHL